MCKLVIVDVCGNNLNLKPHTAVPVFRRFATVQDMIDVTEISKIFYLVLLKVGTTY